MNENVAQEIIDLKPKSSDILDDVLIGLSQSQKTIHPKYLYDKKGSEIFEAICHLPEYYPTRAENEILKSYAREMADMIGSEAVLIEPGSGNGLKVRKLLKEMRNPLAYVPIEISREILMRMTNELHEEFPALKVVPVCADFTANLEFPLSIGHHPGKKVIFFPGSTIGNFHPDDAIGFLKKFVGLMGNHGGLLIGADLKKDKSRIQLAYDDPAGVTAAFNLNLLERLNREINASFDTNNFSHEAVYNEHLGRVEMHLKSKVAQLVRVNKTIFRFKEGETIHTECSYKYTVEEFCELCAKAGLVIRKFWMDTEHLFCVYYFEKE